MKKKVVAMLILTMLVTGCGANGSENDSSVTLQTSEEAQGTDAGMETGSETDIPADDEMADDNTSDIASNDASDIANDETGTGDSSKDGSVDDASEDKSSADTGKSSDSATGKSSDSATDKTSDASSEASTSNEDKADDSATKDEKKDASQTTTPPAEEKKDIASASTLPDGTYNADFMTPDQPHYIKSIEVKGDTVVLEAAIYQFDSNWNTVEIGMGTYTLKINDQTRFLFGGGEEDPTVVSKEEFGNNISKLIGSGLGLSFKIQNGYLVQIGIWS